MSNVASLQTLDNHLIVRSNNIDDARAKISQKVSPHRIEMVGHADLVDVKFSGIDLDGVALMHAYYGCSIKAEPEGSEYFYTHTMLYGNSEIVHGKNQCDTVQGDTVVLSPSAPYGMFLHEKCDRIVLRIEAKKLTSYLSNILCSEVDEGLIFDLKMQNSGAWWNTINYILAQIESEPRVLKSQGVQKAYSKLIISSLLELHNHNYMTNVDVRSENMLCPQVQRAMDFIEFMTNERISAVDVAKHCRVSVRTLQRSFVKQLGDTPTNFIRNAKLDAIHLKLQQASDVRNGSVKRVLLDHGIIDFGRFAQYYRKKYGCTPKETILQNRSTSIAVNCT